MWQWEGTVLGLRRISSMEAYIRWLTLGTAAFCIRSTGQFEDCLTVAYWIIDSTSQESSTIHIEYQSKE